MAAWIGMPRSTTFEMTCARVGMMRVAPGDPMTMKGRPCGSSTSVGLMLDSMRLPGWIELTEPGFRSKSSMSSPMMMPVPGTTTPDAKNMLIVFVTATMFPSRSITLKCVVEPDSYLDGSPGGGSFRTASGLIMAASVRA